MRKSHCQTVQHWNCFRDNTGGNCEKWAGVRRYQASWTEMTYTDTDRGKNHLRELTCIKMIYRWSAYGLFWAQRYHASWTEMTWTDTDGGKDYLCELTCIKMIYQWSAYGLSWAHRYHASWSEWPELTQTEERITYVNWHVSKQITDFLQLSVLHQN